jgi:hypothetical protein
MYDLAKNFEGVSETDARLCGSVFFFEIEKLNESNFESRHRKIT